MHSTTINKTIATNTMFLYFRMIFSTIVSLYTSRVILQILGIDDYGIYQTVGGVVGMLSFINSALSMGSSRFLTYEMGVGNFERLRRTFSSVLTVHIILAVIIVLVAETAGLWFVYNKLVIPSERMDAAIFAYHLSILAVIFSITQVPYNASIISHEKMSVYAYLSIIEVSLKLIIVYMLTIGEWDKLKLYALLFFLVNAGIALFYRFYCIRKFSETHYKPIWDKEIIKGVLGYSGWNLFANAAIALSNQGATILVNMFFSPGVVAARAIANQVNMAAFHFITNFRTAANPQIVKRYAAGDFVGSKSLLLISTTFSYYLMLILALPICLVASPLLDIWLGKVPQYTVSFMQLTIITSLFQVFDSSFYTALYAKGRIRENALISPSVLFISFPVTYILFLMGYSPTILAVVLLVAYAVLGLVIKPLLLIKIVSYTWSDILRVFRPCLNVTVVSLILPIVLYIFREEWFPNQIMRFISLFMASVGSVVVSVWFLGIDKAMKTKLTETVAKKIYLKRQ
ncbi:polysaccharide biosynthesis protein [Prevotella sp. MGM1]|nr:MATE family efflux transporter [Prevotella sp. MGM1]GAY28338.1 polysaccharide biosynthesis protein [Prevotella sp. MGM1]